MGKEEGAALLTITNFFAHQSKRHKHLLAQFVADVTSVSKQIPNDVPSEE